MNQIYMTMPTAELLAHTRPKQMGVQYAVTDDAVDIFLYGLIGDEYTGTDSLTIGRVLADNKGKAVNMRVNSPGGLAYDGVAMFNAIKGHDGHTTGTIEGMAGSAASLAVIACDRVRCYQAAVYEPHYSMVMAFGHQADLMEAIEGLKRLDADLEQTYADASGQDIETVKAQLMGPHGDGTRFSAEEALAAGYVDEVIKHGKKTPTATTTPTTPDAAIQGQSAAMLRHRFEMTKLEFDRIAAGRS